MATSCDSVARPWLVMIAGGVRSGKSTLARELAQRYAGTRVAFGDIVRQRTAALGLPGERRFWQQVADSSRSRRVVRYGNDGSPGSIQGYSGWFTAHANI